MENKIELIIGYLIFVYESYLAVNTPTYNSIDWLKLRTFQSCSASMTHHWGWYSGTLASHAVV